MDRCESDVWVYTGWWEESLQLLLLSIVLLVAFGPISRSPSEGVCLVVLLPRSIGDLKVVAYEELYLTSLSSRELLRGHEVLKTLMIYEYLNR